MKKMFISAILAGGSNVLVADDGFDGLVIHLASKDFSYAGKRDSQLDAGCNCLELIRTASERDLWWLGKARRNSWYDRRRRARQCRSLRHGD